VVLTISTNGAERQHYWCGVSTPHVRSIHTLCDKL